MCQGSQCIFEGYEGECNLTTNETKSIIDRFDKEPCPDFSTVKEEKEYWAWIDQVQDFLDELRAREEKIINEMLGKAMEAK